MQTTCSRQLKARSQASASGAISDNASDEVNDIYENPALLY
jgi:hypothetical protein